MIVIVGTIVIGSLFWLIGLASGQASLSLRLGPVLGAAAGCVYGLGPAYLLLMTPLAVRPRRRPTSRTVAEILRTAHDLKVLRQTGGVYQFRHAALKSHLAEQTPKGDWPDQPE